MNDNTYIKPEDSKFHIKCQKQDQLQSNQISHDTRYVKSTLCIIGSFAGFILNIYELCFIKCATTKKSNNVQQ